MQVFKYIMVALLALAVGYNAVYFKKLDEVKASRLHKEFNAAHYAQLFWNNKLIPNLNKAIDITQLTTLLSKDAAKAFDNYSHALGIGNLRYFLVKGEGVVEFIHEDDVMIDIQSDSGKQPVRIATEYIFGNEVRDATGLIDINEFSNTMDFNNVSAALNGIVREKVVSSFKSAVKKGDTVAFVGAIELNQEHLKLTDIDIVPVSLEITPLLVK